MAKVTSIYSADWHLTARPADEYRWKFFDWLEACIADNRARYLFICGDLTDAKDEHPARLVNRLVRNLRRLAKALTANSQSHASIFIIPGNHDYVNAEEPFFKFLHRAVRGRIFFFSRPTDLGLYRQRFLFLPHTKGFKAHLDKYDFSKYDRVLIHQPVRGALSETGQELEDGINVGPFKGAGKVIAGDVHVPQEIENLVYCGAPYPIRYGDNFTPRVLVETDGEFRSVNRYTVKKAMLRITSAAEFAEAGLTAGDMAKVEIKLPRSAFADWRQISRAVQEQADGDGVKLASIRLTEQIERKRLIDVRTGEQVQTASPRAVLHNYAKAKDVAEGLLPYAEKLLNV